MSTNIEHRSIEPPILYFGTPVAIISSLNGDGTTNLAPMSSFWALGWTVMLGLLDETKTAENLARWPECVINLPSPDMWRHVEALAPLTGKDPVPDIKAGSFRFEKHKFEAANLEAARSELVQPQRVADCPIQMEARIHGLQAMRGERLSELGGGVAVEAEIIRVHAAVALIDDGDHIDPAKWSPLIYNFRHYFRLSERELGKTFRAR